MLRENGIVSDLKGNLAVVHTQNQLACSSCKVVDSCGNGLIEKYFLGKVFRSEIENSLDAKIGDQVVLQMPKSSVTKASIFVYIIPLIGLISFALVSSFFHAKEPLIIFSSFVGLIAGLLVTKYYNRLVVNNEFYTLKMVSIIDSVKTEPAIKVKIL